MKSGQDDGLVAQSCRTVVHSVFKFCEPHGDVYAYVSEWLAQHMSSPDGLQSTKGIVKNAREN